MSLRVVKKGAKWNSRYEPINRRSKKKCFVAITRLA